MQSVEHAVEFKMNTDKTAVENGADHHKINARDFIVPTQVLLIKRSSCKVLSSWLDRCIFLYALWQYFQNLQIRFSLENYCFRNYFFCKLKKIFEWIKQFRC